MASLELGGGEPKEIAQKQRVCLANLHLWSSDAASHGKSQTAEAGGTPDHGKLAEIKSRKAEAEGEWAAISEAAADRAGSRKYSNRGILLVSFTSDFY